MDYVTAFGTVFAAIGTVAAVVLALYLNVFREQRRQPKLRLDLPEGLSRDDPEVTLFVIPEASPDYFIPVVLAVTNERGKKTASSVEVLLTAQWLTKDSQHVQARQKQLVWDVLGEPTQVDIPPGVSRSVVVMWMGYPRAVVEHVLPHPDAWASIDPDLQAEQEGMPGVFGVASCRSVDDLELVFSQRYRLTFDITAQDTDLATFQAEIETSAGPGTDDVEDWIARLNWVDPPRRTEP